MEFSSFYDKHAVGVCMEFIAAGRSRNIKHLFPNVDPASLEG